MRVNVANSVNGALIANGRTRNSVAAVEPSRSISLSFDSSVFFSFVNTENKPIKK